ncbi:type II toxin-antitoxin system RelE/ParE family toxin [Pseudomonas sp. R2.Fl]|nr:type II toxin-antitoxin system RelE/ParE family toxin [Pseudomonas sp. R2.Fl]
MSRYVFTPKAEQDIRDIWRWIAQDNEQAADAMLSTIFKKLEQAAHHPLMGVKRTDLSETARILVARPYIIIYEPVQTGLLVVAIVHGARERKRWLSDDPNRL